MTNLKEEKNFYKENERDKLMLGNCSCLIRNKYTGRERLADGFVALMPYKNNVSKETKKKYGKNLVYVIHRSDEEVVGYYQSKNSSYKKYL